MTTAVKIPPQRVSWLGFDLREVMAALDPGDDLTWRLRDAVLTIPDDADPDKWQAVAYDSRTSEGTAVSWAQMVEMADACPRVVAGTFTGFRNPKPVVQLRAVDGKYWIVWAQDYSTLERVRERFAGVENYDERTPHR